VRNKVKEIKRERGTVLPWEKRGEDFSLFPDRQTIMARSGGRQGSKEAVAGVAEKGETFLKYEE